VEALHVERLPLVGCFNLDITDKPILFIQVRCGGWENDAPLHPSLRLTWALLVIVLPLFAAVDALGCVGQDMA
jgi:hypothetical protein